MQEHARLECFPEFLSSCVSVTGRPFLGNNGDRVILCAAVKGFLSGNAGFLVLVTFSFYLPFFSAALCADYYGWSTTDGAPAYMKTVMRVFLSLSPDMWGAP